VAQLHEYRQLSSRPASRRLSRELVGRNNELGVRIAAHAIDGSGDASSDRVGVAAGMLGRDCDRAIGTSYDGAFVIEGIGTTEVDDEPGVLRTAHKSNSGPCFNAEGFVGLGVGNARGRSGIGAPAALDVDGAGRGSRTAGVGCGTNTSRIGSRADVVLNFLFFGVLADDETGQKERQDKQTEENCKIAVKLH
jgi:hypothetical protein